MATERLAVLLSGRVVGHLGRPLGTDEVSFAYTPDYLRDGVVAVSAQLPISRQLFAPRKVLPYLFGLLPESDRARGAWASELGVGMDDAFGLLAKMGWDCPGAVQFCREEDLDLLRVRGSDHEAVDDRDIAARLRALAGGEPSWTMPGEHWSLGGHQEKFALARFEGAWHVAHGAAATTHIVKPGIAALHHQALIEHLTMAAAAELGATVARSAYLRFEDQWAVVIDRFDRTVDGRRVARIHQEDFVQAAGRLPRAKCESGGGPGLADMMRIIRGQSTEMGDDRLALADFLIINVVAGAPDGHAKNISLLRRPGQVSIAPLYDLATGLAYDARKVERAVAVSVGGERQVSRIHRKQWEKAAQVLGLAPELMLQRVADLATRFEPAFAVALAGMSGVPGVDEVADRALPALRLHAGQVLARL